MCMHYLFAIRGEEVAESLRIHSAFGVMDGAVLALWGRSFFEAGWSGFSIRHKIAEAGAQGAVREQTRTPSVWCRFHMRRRSAVTVRLVCVWHWPDDAAAFLWHISPIDSKSFWPQNEGFTKVAVLRIRCRVWSCWRRKTQCSEKRWRIPQMAALSAWLNVRR